MNSRILFLAGILAGGAYAHTLNTGGLSGINTTYSAYSLGQGSHEIGFSGKGEFGDEALEETLADGSRNGRDVILSGWDVFLALGLTNWMDLAVDLPFYRDHIDGFSRKASGLGDLSASLKIMHPGMKPDALVRLAYIMRASFPTGDPGSGYFARDPQYSHVSETNTEGAFTSRGYNLNPMLAWTFDLTRLKRPAPWLVHVNFGMDALFYAAKDVNIPQENTAMKGGLAVEWLAQSDWSLFLDFYGKSRLINITEGPFLEIFAKDQLALAMGASHLFNEGLSASFVVEGGLSTQENRTRWSVYHGGAGVRNYSIQPTPVLGATVTVGFGGMGRNADPDFDGNPNSTDRCPHDAEDYDGYEDVDGCPDPVHLSAPVQVIDTVVITQFDTVTVVRNDTVRVPVLDTLNYRAQQDPNVIFGFGKVTFPSIQFMTGSDELDRSSFKILNDIAQSMKNFPDVNLQVLGFTDNTGTEAANRSVSSRRAESVVDYLVNQGLSATRLQPIGMGPENPVGSNRTASGRLLNRRVEFKRVK
ncbi:MAG: OmpA family protein [Fibrobacteres bacterium]|nr:OmpA family protein [Fibrobacterota bacterium]